MTTLFAITDGTNTAIACDRQVTTGYRKNSKAVKWFEARKGLWVGSTGWLRIQQLLQKKLEENTRFDVPTPVELVEHLEEWLPEWSTAPRAESHSPGPDTWDISLLVAWPGGVVSIGEDLCVTEHEPMVPAAEGSGGDFALSAGLALVRAGETDLEYIAKESVKISGMIDLHSHGLWSKVLTK